MVFEGRLQQIDLDLRELAAQMATGEIDEQAGSRLRRAYLAERETVAAGIAATSIEPSVRSPRRMILGGTILVLALAVSVGVAGTLVQERDDGPLLGVTSDNFDLDTVTNEQMEAVIGAYEQDPAVADQIPNMRFRLAERYFAEGAFDQAFDHYDEIIRSTRAGADIIGVSLTRVAWMVWLQQEEPTLALELIDRSLDLLPANPEALYVKGQLLWCGAGDAAAAIPLFEEVIDSGSLPPEVMEQIQSDLAAASAGESC